MQGHFSAVTSLALTPNGWGLLSAGRDKTAMLWDLRTHAQLATVPVFETVEGKLCSAFHHEREEGLLGCQGTSCASGSGLLVSLLMPSCSPSGSNTYIQNPHKAAS